MALKNLVEVNVGARNTEWCNSWIWEECNIHLRLTTFWRRGNRPRGPWPHLTSLLKVIHRSSTQDPTSILQVDSSFLFSSPGSERVCVCGGGLCLPPANTGPYLPTLQMHSSDGIRVDRQELSSMGNPVVSPCLLTCVPFNEVLRGRCLQETERERGEDRQEHYYPPAWRNTFPGAAKLACTKLSEWSNYITSS